MVLLQFLMEFSSARWQTIFKFYGTVYGRRLIVTSHVWACKVCCRCCFELQGRKSKKYFRKFVQIVRSLESNNCNATTNNSKPKKTYRWMFWISMVRNGMVLQKLQHFVTWLAGISTDFYCKELIEIGTKPAFSVWHWA